MRSIIFLIRFLLMVSALYISGAVVYWLSAVKKRSEDINPGVPRGVPRRFPEAEGVRLTLSDRLQIKYIERSGVMRYIPFFNSGILLALCLFFFVMAIFPVFRVVRYAPSALAISFLFSMSPIFVLDIMARYNTGVIRKSLSEFISVLNRWCAVKEDVFFAFEKSLESGVKEPLATYIRDMVIQVKRGIRPEEALEMLKLKVNNRQFADFVVNIKQNIKHRGDTRKLLSNLEEQFYKTEEEYNRRKISTFRDRVTIYILMVAVFFICYGFIRINPDVEAFYLGTARGKMLVMLFCVLYGAGFYISLGISRYEY